MRIGAVLLALASALHAAGPLDVPFFRQEKNGCGAASLAMVAHYWRPGAAPDHSAIYAKLIDAERKGIALSAMKQYLEEIGFQAFTLRGEWADLTSHLSKGRPIIVALKAGRSPRLHFAVLTGVDERHVWLNDPTRKGAQQTQRERFEKQWSGAERWMLLASPRAGK